MKKVTWRISLGLILALMILVSLSSTVLADESTVITVPAEIETYLPSGSFSPSGAAEGYIRQAFYGKKRNLLTALYGTTAQNQLTGNDLIVYKALRKQIEEVAAGTRSSTVFTVPVTALCGKTSFTATDLGLAQLSENGSYEKAVAAIRNKISFDSNRVLDALLYDCPYDLYWFDKTAPVSIQGPSLRDKS